MYRQDCGHSLCLVGGNGGSIDSISNTSNASPDDKLSSCARSRRYGSDLDNHANDHDASSQKHGFTSSELVAKGEDKACADQAADCEN